MPHFIFIQQISVLNILNMLYNLHFFSSKCRLFHNTTLFGFCITHILNTGVPKFEKKNIRRQKVKFSNNMALLITGPQRFTNILRKLLQYQHLLRLSCRDMRSLNIMSIPVPYSARACSLKFCTLCNYQQED